MLGRYNSPSRWFATSKFIKTNNSSNSSKTLRTIKGRILCFSTKKNAVKKKFAVARVKIFLVTCISRNKSIFLFSLIVNFIGKIKLIFMTWTMIIQDYPNLSGVFYCRCENNLIRGFSEHYLQPVNGVEKLNLNWLLKIQFTTRFFFPYCNLLDPEKTYTKVKSTPNRLYNS